MSTLPKPGPNRVAAWIYTVINPSIDGLRREAHLLQASNLSWRYYSQRFEYIRPIREHIEPSLMPNLEDFLAQYPAFDDKFDLHDRKLGAAEGRATELYKLLVAAPAFQQHVEETFQQYESGIKSTPTYAASVEPIREHLPKYIAENLINQVHELPAHYTIHSFWKSFGQRFWNSLGNDPQAYLAEFDYNSRNQSFEELKRATAELKEVSSGLEYDLEQQRRNLSQEFDVPPAPPTPARSIADTFSL